MTKLMMIAALAATTAFASPALADNTDTTTVSARVPAVCTIDGPGDSGLNLTGTTQLGAVSVTCNSPTGFTASVKSGNNGHLADSSGGGSPTTYDYTLTVGGFGTVALTSPQSFDTSAFAGSAGYVADHPGISTSVALNVTHANGSAFAGTYSDVLTWTIEAN